MTRTNADVARLMLVWGIVSLAAAVVLDFFAMQFHEFTMSLPYAVNDVVLRLWSLVLRLGYALGPVLIIGAIIVNRLPERKSRPGESGSSAS